MCYLVRIDSQRYLLKHREHGLRQRDGFAALLLIFFCISLSSRLFAENRSEEYLTVKNWKLPSEAVPETELTLEEGIYSFQGQPFSGIAYSNYPHGQLLRAVSYRHGKQDGPMFLWYPDGTPQMSANYRSGVLHGRFLGWYQNGDMIYDMMINRGTYAGDSLAEGDESRAASDSIDDEREGPDNDQSRE